MATHQSFEETLRDQLQQVKELETATVFIQNKEGLREALLEARQDIDAIKKGLICMRQNLDEMKVQNEACKQLMSLYTALDKRILDMTEKIPPALLEHLAKEFKVEKAPASAPKSARKPQAYDSCPDVSTDIVHEEVKDCKKALFTELEDTYTIDSIGEDEFAKIPKYMIGRQTLANVNAFVASINQILKAKYGLLALGKNGARKRGDLELYMQLKREETDVKGPGKDAVYFFTADDYQREIKGKLDKTKLNLLTVLRHCKRLHELRTGKNVKYQVLRGF